MFFRKNLLFLMIIMIISTALYAQDRPVMLFYYSEDCEHCKDVQQEFLPGFLETYGEHFDFVVLEVSEPAIFDSLYAMESRTNVPEEDKDYPAVYFMGTMIEGEIPVRTRLASLVRNYLSNPDSAQRVDREVMARIPEQIEPGALTSSKNVHIAYFYEKGCEECSRAEEIITWLENMYSNIVIDQFDIGTKENKIIATALGVRTGIPEDRIMSTPVFFIGEEEYVLSEDISRSRIIELVQIYSKSGTEPVWAQLTDSELGQAQSYMKTQFQSFAIFTIALAGLVDGINPCAFATILFFISYLGMVGRKKTEILLVGLSFAFAVFITYFLLGLGFFKFVESIANIEFLAKVIFGGTAAICIVFGVLSINDYALARKGKTSEMTLQLPNFLKRRIHATIREKVRMEGIVAGAIIAGFMISLLELACTGQVYLPTITFMVGVTGYTFQAVLYLLLYNICFIIPLLFVFGIVYFGVSSHAIAHFMESKVGLVKLVLAGVFFTVGGLLIWAVFI